MTLTNGRRLAAREANEEAKLKARIAIEKRIARLVVKDALAAGYAVSVDNGADDGSLEIENSTSFGKIVEALFATDEDRLLLMKEGKCKGWVLFIYGNDGYDVIADYTTNLEEEVLKGAEALADKFEEKYG